MVKEFVVGVALVAFGASMASAAPKAAAGEKGRKHAQRVHGKKDGAHHKHKRGRMGAERMARELDLSETQRAQMKELLRSERERNAGLREQISESRRDYLELRKADDPRAEAEKAELQRLQDEMKQRRAETREQMLRLLTPEQRRKAEQMRAEREARRGEKRQRENRQQREERGRGSKR